MVYFGAWRVNGNLSVSRAIGDVEHKPYVSGEPCISEFTIEGNKIKKIFLHSYNITKIRNHDHQSTHTIKLHAASQAASQKLNPSSIFVMAYIMSLIVRSLISAMQIS